MLLMFTAQNGIDQISVTTPRKTDLLWSSFCERNLIPFLLHSSYTLFFLSRVLLQLTFQSPVLLTDPVLKEQKQNLATKMTLSTKLITKSRQKFRETLTTWLF